MRRALGATRGQLVRQLLVESLVVALAGGAARARRAGVVEGLDRRDAAGRPAAAAEVRFDGGMVAIGLALSIVAGVVFGIVPALQVSGVNPGDNLKDAGRGGGASRRERRFRGALVAAEIAISLVLLVGAGLLVRSFWSMLQVKPGLDPARVGFAQIWIPVPNDPSKNPYGTPAQRNAYINEVLQPCRRAARRRVGRDERQQPDALQRIGRDAALYRSSANRPRPADVRRAQFQVASPDYFATLKSPILSGRAFTAADTIGTEPVVIVNETLAKTQSPGKDPVGRSISLGRQSARIVGVVADIHDDGLDVPVSSRIYFPLFQRSNNALTVFYRSSTDPASLGSDVERAIHAVDPTLPVFGQSTMEDLLAVSTVRRKVVLIADGHVRRRRAAAGGDRHLRRDERRRERARARDWHPHGARRAAARHRAADGASGPRARRRWRRGRHRQRRVRSRG